MTVIRRLVVVGIALALVLPALAQPASASPGHLDTSFSGDGKVILNSSPGGDEAHDVLIQPDGKIVVLVNVDQSGANQRFGVYRFLPNGKPDKTFNGTGKNLFNFGPSSALWADAIAITPTGRIVVAGRTSASGGGYAFARLTKAGHLDTTFGAGGKAVIPPSTGEVFDLAVQQDGKVVFVGRTGSPSNGVVGRLTTAGQLDPKFGNSGTQDVTFVKSDSFLSGVVIRPNGKILAAGFGGNSTSRSNDVGIVQLKPDGSFDLGFGFGGEVVKDFGANEGGEAVALQGGKIVVAGSRSTKSTTTALLARFTANGTLDTSFGTNGRVFANVGDGSANRLAVAADGRLLVVGPWRQTPTAGGFFLMRRKPNGSADTSFGGPSGIVRPGDTYDGAPAVAIQDDGRIVVAEATNGTGAPEDAFVARYLAA